MYDNFKIREFTFPEIVVKDNFFENPDEVREFALGLNFVAHPKHHKGKRTESVFLNDGIKQSFERLLGCEIKTWNLGINGCFQTCNPKDPIVFHSDSQSYAGAIYLTPDAPLEGGTSFYRSKLWNIRRSPSQEDSKRLGVPLNRILHDVYSNKLLDRTKWDLVDTVGNVYNRLVLWDAKLIHAASSYFGHNLQTGRLFQLFFFDV